MRKKEQRKKYKSNYRNVQLWTMNIHRIPVFTLSLVFVLINNNSTEAQWHREDVDSNHNSGYYYTSLALDSFNHPHISYYDFHGLQYAYYNGSSWQIDTVDSAFCRCISLALDGVNHPHISHYDVSNSDLKYAYHNGSNWEIQTVDSSGNVGEYSSLALDSANHPHISYYDSYNHDLKYAYYNGSNWEIQTVDSSGDVGTYTSLALDSGNHPHISYYSYSNSDLKYAYHNGSNWEMQTVDSNFWDGSYNSLALDSSNHPHISYYSYSNSALNYAYHNGSNWEIDTVDQNGSEGPYQYTSLALDSANHPHISYYDSDNKDLKYAYYNGLGWGIETVDSNGDAGIYNSLVLDTFDCPFISYSYFTQAYALKYTFKDADGDRISDGQDNCLHTPNGPDLGTCYSWSGSAAACTSDADCGGASGSCGMAQEDSYPPGGNGCGDACECHADCNNDQKVDLTDLVTMKTQFFWKCSEHPSSLCEADCNYDGNVNLSDLVMMKSEFNRTDCPVCP